jgi:xanthosine utilization system XapX-like protein
MTLPWPCDDQTVLCSIAEYVFNEWTPESLENIRSCITPETKQLLGLELAKLGVTLDQQIRTMDQQAVHKSCLRIKALAPLLGHVAMKSAIDNLTERVEVEDTLEELAPELTEIADICKTFRTAA